MKKLILSFLFLGFMAAVSPIKTQAQNGQEVLKKQINSMVDKVEEIESADKKREVLDESLSDLIEAIDKVNGKPLVSDTDKEKLKEFKKLLSERKNELNGADGFAKVPNNQINNFANFIQQDIEQADTIVTLSLTTVLLIILILLLL